MSLRIVVASANPVKVEAARAAFSAVFADTSVDLHSVSAPSDVAEQPMSASETYEGAVNRVRFCQAHHQSDYYVSYEGGVDLLDGIASTFAIVAISDGKRLQTGRTASLPLPQAIYQKLLAGGELGPAMDAMFNTVNIKHKGGAIGQLTQGLETRLSTYKAATILTLTPFVHPQWY